VNSTVAIIMIFVAGVTVLVQLTIYEFIKRMRMLLVIPVVCTILAYPAWLIGVNPSIRSPRGLALSAFLFGIQIVIGGLLGYLFAWRKENHF